MDGCRRGNDGGEPKTTLVGDPAALESAAAGRLGAGHDGVPGRQIGRHEIGRIHHGVFMDDPARLRVAAYRRRVEIRQSRNLRLATSRRPLLFRRLGGSAPGLETIIHAIVASVWPSCTASPTLTLTTATLPERGAKTKVFIFMASSVKRWSPSFTSWPAVTTTAVT